MTLDELKQGIREYIYIEDDTVIDATLACVIANRLRFGNPVWLVLIGASSGGKSQILTPLVMSDPAFVHQLDDITENTLLSGMKVKDDEGNKVEMSYLNREVKKHGIIVLNDLSVLFSRAKESRDAVLSQFRMLYDGKLVKQVGNSEHALSWTGYLGVIAGSTPNIYRHLEEVADMGERFMYWRLKPYNEKNASLLALSRGLNGIKLNEYISSLYAQYLKMVVYENSSVDISSLVSRQRQEEIVDIALFSEKIRTPVYLNFNKTEVEKLPVPAFPMRTAQQLMNIARGLAVLRQRDLDDHDMDIIRWIGWSLANEERRACLTVLAKYSTSVSSSGVANAIGLSTNVTNINLQTLASLGLVTRSKDGGKISWRLNDLYLESVRRVTKVVEVSEYIGEDDEQNHEEMAIDERW